MKGMEGGETGDKERGGIGDVEEGGVWGVTKGGGKVWGRYVRRLSSWWGMGGGYAQGQKVQKNEKEVRGLASSGEVRLTIFRKKKEMKGFLAVKEMVRRLR